MDAFRERLQQLGFVEGRNLQIVEGFQPVDPAALRDNVQQLIRARPDVILSFGSTNSLMVSAEAGRIPVVFTIVGDAVAYGLVKELRHPGGNVTGVSVRQRENALKRLELLREMLPRAKRIVVAGFLQDVTYRANETLYRDTAARLGFELVNADGNAGPLARTTTAAVQQGADAIFIFHPISLVTPPPVAEDILRLATERRIPVFVAESELVAQGGLLSYGPVFVDETRRAADMVARVLMGANAGDLAVDQTSRFEVVVNLKTAKSLGIVVPQSILLRADRVIE